MNLILATLVIFSIAVLLHQIVMRKDRRKNLPPGPRSGFHLRLLQKNAHHQLHELSKKHGPIMYMKLGLVQAIIVSSSQAAEKFLKTHDLNFASRPPHEAMEIISYGQLSMVFSPYGPYWRNMRKLLTVHLLSKHKINSFESMRREEVRIFVESLKCDAQNHAIVDLSAKVSSLSTNMNCMMILGRKYADKDIDEKGFEDVINEISQLAGAPNIADFIPFLGALDIQGLRKRLKAIVKISDAFLERVIDEHEQSENQGNTKDFVDTMIDIMKSGEAEFRFDRRHVKAVLLDSLVGSIHTSTTFIVWTLTELLRHPQIMKKLKKEMAEKIRMKKEVEESDLDNLEYLKFVVKEAQRLHSGFVIPRQAIEDCTIDGYHIPKKSTIFVNTYSIQRDPNVWNDPEKFIPERFVGKDIDVRGEDFQIIPFGSGRRRCPGMDLGLIVVRLVVAQLVHCFDWELPSGMLPEELDMTEELGLTIAKAKPLMAIPSYRLHG